jgi:nucleotide-binding universal stress UspA family protein
MNSDKRIEYQTRDAILKLLTDAEIARVGTEETAPRLSEGEEYLDLGHLEQGVQRARGTSAFMGRALPRRAVHDGTWLKIEAHLAASGIVKARGDLAANGVSHAGAAPVAGRFVLLAAVDDSDCAAGVLSAATGFARLIPGAEVHLLYVLENLSGLDPHADLSLEVQEGSFEKGRVRLEDLAREARAHSTTRMIAHVAIGNPWREIVQTAASVQADLVLVGTHDRDGIASALLGSVAQTVARKAPCPVLIVRPKSSRHGDVPEIEPPCPDCMRAQAESGGRTLWCAHHNEHHARARCHYEVPESFGLGSMLIRN